MVRSSLVKLWVTILYFADWRDWGQITLWRGKIRFRGTTGFMTAVRVISHYWGINSGIIKKKGIHLVSGLFQIFHVAILDVSTAFIDQIHTNTNLFSTEKYLFLNIRQCQTHIMFPFVFWEKIFHHPWILPWYHLFFIIIWNYPICIFAAFLI